MISYVLQGAIREKSSLHKRASHASAQSLPQAIVYNRIYSLCFIIHGLGMQIVFY